MHCTEMYVNTLCSNIFLGTYIYILIYKIQNLIKKKVDFSFTSNSQKNTKK